MPDLFARLISIKLILEEMEQDLGLEALSEVEKNVYLAAQALKSSIGRVETKQIQAHSFTQNMSRPTFFRALIPFSKLELYSLKTRPVNMIAEIISIFFAGLFSSFKFFLR